ncbi:MAG: hypothetical protein IKP61_07625 [Spirochaetales bacterium]|nr:hypothetical protein [Spirochaetales bacterium]
MRKMRVFLPLLILFMLLSLVSCDKVSEVRNWGQDKKNAVSGSIDELSSSVKDASKLNEESSRGEIVDATTGVISSLTKLILNIF